MRFKNSFCVLSSCLVLLIPIILSGFIDHSIMPKVSNVENFDNLAIKKYSMRQLEEIKNVLKRSDESIRLVTYNVLFNLHDNQLEEVNRWPQRLPRIVELFEEMLPDVICVQELYPSQLKDLMPFISDKYHFYSRDCEEGELNGIFYRKDRFEVVKQNVYPLNSSENLESNQPISLVQLSDTLTMLQLKDLKTGRIFSIFNTHFAFSKVDKREYQARYISENIEAFSDGYPTILTGDLNTFPNRADLNKILFLDGDYIHRILTKGKLKDARTESLLGHLGPIATFTNVNEDPNPFMGTGTPGIFLDHIYVSPGVQVIIHAVQPARVNGHYPSDHLPVLMDFLID